MTNQELLKTYIPMVDFLATILGKNSEIALYDTSQLDHSIIAIRNNHITQRDVGAPATDMVLRNLEKEKNTDTYFESNYVGYSPVLKKTLRSSTFIIRNRGEIVGLLCIVTDDSILKGLQHNLEEFFSTFSYENTTSQERAVENYTTSLYDFADEVIENYAITKGINRDYFKVDDKIEIVRQLHEKNYFLMKGAVLELANLLNSSEPTIYRYLQQAKR